MLIEAPLPAELATFLDNLNAQAFDLLIFDWDGTLMDSAGLIVDSIQPRLRGHRPACAERACLAPDHRPWGRCRRCRPCCRICWPTTIHGWSSATATTTSARHAEILLFAGVASGIRDLLSQSGFELLIATGPAASASTARSKSAAPAVLFVATRCADQTHSEI